MQKEITMSTPIICSDLSEMRAAISGVNFDEEASNLMHYQASYEAAARVITVSNGLLLVL